MIRNKYLFFYLYILASAAYYLLFKDSHYYWQNTDSGTYLEVGQTLYEDGFSFDYLIYLLNNNLLGMGLIGYLSYFTTPDDFNEIFIAFINFIIIFYIITNCEKISKNLNLNLDKRFYIALTLNPIFISYSFSINKELIASLILLVFLLKILKNDHFYSYIFIIIMGYFIRDGLGILLFIALFILSFNINILYFIVALNFLAKYLIRENALLAFSGDDGNSIFNLNDIFIWMQTNFLYFLVVPFKFIVTVFSALPFRNGMPESGNIIGYLYLINSFLMVILLFMINKLFTQKFNLNIIKIIILIYIYISIMLLTPFINQRYLIPIYPLFFIILLSNNEKNT